jgi:hypothetical protein
VGFVDSLSYVPGVWVTNSTRARSMVVLHVAVDLWYTRRSASIRNPEPQYVVRLRYHRLGYSQFRQKLQVCRLHFQEEYSRREDLQVSPALASRPGHRILSLM